VQRRSGKGGVAPVLDQRGADASTQGQQP
jgi:hypothetical protein